MLFKQEPVFPKCYKKASKPHKYCPGCGHGIVLKELGFAIDSLRIQKNTLIGVDIGCSLLAWDFFDVNTIQTHHGRTIPVISGYKTVERNKIGIAYVGDGGAYAIGLQSLIYSAHRNDPITVIIINNTLYGMTGGQMAPTTLIGELTSTSPTGKKTEPFYGPELIRQTANKNAYIARGMVTQTENLRNILIKAIKNQIDNNCFSMVEVLSMCPVNWKKNAKESIDYLETNMKNSFKLGEL